jgi:polar amino acid transport system substrate-binding protein
VRKLVLLALPVVALALLAAGLAQGKPTERGRTAAALAGCSKGSLHLLHAGKLTIGTDNPAFPPWFDGVEKKGSTFKTSNPYSGKGYESAVAYAVASRLGFKHSDVTWTPVAFLRSFAPGNKPFDFYLAQVSFKPVRAKTVTFSSSYYFVNQAVVGLKGTKITKVKSVAGLKPFQFGVPLGTTSYDYVVKYIKPNSKPKVYDTLNDAVTALKNKQIDGLVVDFPSTGYITAVQVPNSTVVGRLPSKTNEHFGMVFQKGNPLVVCVNKALSALTKNGTIKKLESKYLAGSAPLLK